MVLKLILVLSSFRRDGNWNGLGEASHPAIANENGGTSILHICINIQICAFWYSKVCPLMSLVLGIRSVCMWPSVFCTSLSYFWFPIFQLVSNPDLVTNEDLSDGPHFQFRQTPPVPGEISPDQPVHHPWTSGRAEQGAAALPSALLHVWQKVGWIVSYLSLSVSYRLSVIAVYRVWGKKVHIQTPWLALATTRCFLAWAMKWSQAPSGVCSFQRTNNRHLVRFLSVAFSVPNCVVVLFLSCLANHKPHKSNVCLHTALD